MTKYDSVYIKTLKELLDSPNSTVGYNVRPKYANGVPAHTKFITHHIESYYPEEGLPITTLRPIAVKTAIKEYLAFFQDQTSDLKVLREKHGINYWDQWEVGETGTIGIRYGATIKRYNLMNQLLDGIKNDPLSRRHIIDLYQYQDFTESAGLYPCQFLFTFTVRGRYLDLITFMRSSDFLVASDINRLQAIALQYMVARSCGYEVGKFTHITDNLHIYDNQYEAANELLHRYHSGEKTETDSPKLILNGKKDFYEWTIEDFSIENYHPIQPQIKFELAI